MRKCGAGRAEACTCPSRPRSDDTGKQAQHAGRRQRRPPKLFEHGETNLPDIAAPTSACRGRGAEMRARRKPQQGLRNGTVTPVAHPDHGISLCQAGLLAHGSQPMPPVFPAILPVTFGRTAHRLQLRVSSGFTPDSLLASTSSAEDHDARTLFVGMSKSRVIYRTSNGVKVVHLPAKKTGGFSLEFSSRHATQCQNDLSASARDTADVSNI
ncbi:hypothetical protein GGR00_004629 [Aminobacter aganoensis]|uniref:Uncharacterized protein n=1 Tax=Aminobacter aganoensis TaxID=83264 RepID=A0A7X0FBT6_9HYPH|nr:hypothetical protein [Aminobacter aganoensis]